MRQTLRSSRDYVSWVQHLEVTNALKKLKNLQLENLDDAYIILMPMLQFVNKVKMERITVFMRNRESAF